MSRHDPSSGVGGYHCVVCGLAVEYSPEKGAMVDISGSTYCPDLEPHRTASHRIATYVPAPGQRLSVVDLFRAAVDCAAAEPYDVEAGWLRFRTWLIEQGYVVPDDGPPHPREDQGV